MRKGERAVDWWSIPHFAAGVALGMLGLGWITAAFLIVAYEFVEGGLRRVKLQDGGLFEYESWPNIFMDLVIGFAGFALFRLLFPAFRLFDFSGRAAGW